MFLNLDFDPKLEERLKVGLDVKELGGRGLNEFWFSILLCLVLWVMIYP